MISAPKAALMAFSGDEQLEGDGEDGSEDGAAAGSTGGGGRTPLIGVEGRGEERKRRNVF